MNTDLQHMPCTFTLQHNNKYYKKPSTSCPKTPARNKTPDSSFSSANNLIEKQLKELQVNISFLQLKIESM